MVAENGDPHNHEPDERAEPGFFGSLIMTAEHILGKTSGTVPVIGLFISSLGAFASLLYYRKDLSHFEIGVRAFLGIAFSALGIAVILFPPIGIFVGISAAGYSVLSNAYEWITHRIKPIKTPVAHKELKQKAANFLMSLVVLSFIVTALLIPPTAVPLLTAFITITVIYTIYSFTDKVRDAYKSNNRGAPAEQPGPALPDGVTEGLQVQQSERGAHALEEFEADPNAVPHNAANADAAWAHNPGIEAAEHVDTPAITATTDEEDKVEGEDGEDGEEGDAQRIAVPH